MSHASVSASRPRAIARCALLSLSLAAAPLPLHAAEGNPWTVFAEFGVAEGDDSQRMPQAGLRFARLTPGRVAPEFSVHAWREPYLIATADLSFALPIAPSAQTRLTPRAGASLIILSDGRYGSIMPAPSVGAGLVLAANRPLLLRVDYTMRFMPQLAFNDENRTMQEVTVGLSWRGYSATR